MTVTEQADLVELNSSVLQWLEVQTRYNRLDLLRQFRRDLQCRPLTEVKARWLNLIGAVSNDNVKRQIMA